MSHTTVADESKPAAAAQLNIPAVRGVLQKYQDSTNLVLFLLVISWLPFAVIASQAMQEVVPAGSASQFRFQSSVIAIAMCLLISGLITMANWFALRKVAQAIDDASAQQKPSVVWTLPPLPQTGKMKRQ